VYIKNSFFNVPPRISSVLCGAVDDSLYGGGVRTCGEGSETSPLLPAADQHPKAPRFWDSIIFAASASLAALSAACIFDPDPFASSHEWVLTDDGFLPLVF
ncbi:hypothetical protein Taro_047559, partial [Colocasia esculenta]|nr:hypothetical protein [Colocasia esculenta]